MDAPVWKVELHAHTIYSKDCLTRLDALQPICRGRGIDKLAITDHNTAKASLELARLYPMWIIPGEEIMTAKGELLAWYIREEVPAGLSPKETVGILKDQGAVIGVPHPFDRYRKGAWNVTDLLEIVDEVDSVEVFNARCIHGADNQLSLAFAREHNKIMTAGSDAHIAKEYGQAVTLIRPFANTAEAFRKALAECQRQEAPSSPLVHLGSTYAKWLKRLVPSMQPS